jgi:toxin YoeB
MNVLFTRAAWTDYLIWQDSDREIADRINRLVAEIQRAPFIGIGKPEPLRGNMTGWWSRRLTNEHRLVYRIVGTGELQRLEIMSCRYHYSRRN